MHTTDLTFDQALYVIAGSLNHSSSWASRDTLSFLIANVECENVPNLSEIEMEYHIYPLTAPPVCPQGALACTNEVGDPVTHGTRTHYDKMITKMDSGRVTQFFVNHEGGHSVGLADPTPSQTVDQEAETCRIRYNLGVDADGDSVKDTRIVPVWSIMHASYCSQVPISAVPLPTDFDLWSFDGNVAAHP